MRKIAALLLSLLPAIALAQADSDPINTLPAATPSSASWGQVREFLRDEDADRFDEQGFTPLVISGCTHSTGAGLNGTPAACVAYPGGYRISTPGAQAITYLDASTTWVIANKDASANLGSFTRVSGTHFLTDEADSQPTLPADSVWLMKVTTSGGAITAVADLREMSARGPPGFRDVREFGAVGDGLTDDTDAIQAAINAATQDPTLASWKDDFLAHGVYVPCAPYGYLIKGHLEIPEGAYILGENVNCARIWLHSDNWTSGAPKIRDVFYDGTTQSQQMSIRNITFMLSPFDIAALSALSSVAVVDFKRAVEFDIQDSRFVLHAGYAANAPWNVVAGSYTGDGIVGIKLAECVHFLINNVHFDQGRVHIYSLRDSLGDNNNGMAFGRITNNLFYSAKDYGIHCGSQCELNTISGNIFDQTSIRGGGAASAIWIDNSNGNSTCVALDDPLPCCTGSGTGACDSEHNTIVANSMRTANTPLVIDGRKNAITGNVIIATQSGETSAEINGNDNVFSGNTTKGTGTTYEVTIAGDSNTVWGNTHEKENAHAVGEAVGAVGNTIATPYKFVQGGFQRVVLDDVALTTSGTWVDTANLYMPDTQTVLTARVHLTVPLTGVTTKLREQTFYIKSASDGVLSVAEALDASSSIVGSAETFEAGNNTTGQIESQWVVVDDDNIKLQVRRADGGGSSSNASVILTLTTMAEESKQRTFFVTDLGL